MKYKFIKFYSNVCDEVAQLSECKKLKVGAILVKDENIISYGYNGPPRKLSNCCEDENGITKEEVVHAEENALLKAARSSNSSKDSIMFCTHSPCLECAKLIIQAGVSLVYYKIEYRNKKGLYLLADAGIRLCKM